MSDKKISTEAARYATSRVGERGERAMPNEYEWDAIAIAFDAGLKSRWIPISEQLPPHGEEVVALINRNNMYPHTYICRYREPFQNEERWVAWMPIPKYAARDLSTTSDT